MQTFFNLGINLNVDNNLEAILNEVDAKNRVGAFPLIQ